MKLIVGLGNPGKKYEKTRHNVGFMVLDALAEGGHWGSSKSVKAEYIKTSIDGQNVELFKPQTFMNESGSAVATAANKNGVSPVDILVIHDDIDVPLGEVKIQSDRGAAGHNGIKSIIQHLGTQDFTRVRVGIKPSRQKGDTSKFVLGRFGIFEKGKLKSGISAAKHAAHDWLTNY